MLFPPHIFGLHSQRTQVHMTENRAAISIVVPTYNERDNIAMLISGLRAALEETWEFEVIVVDDGSPDGTADVVRSAASEFPSIRLVERPRKLRKL